MENRLEEFIKNNRSEFDDERPSFKVWADIEQSLNGRKRRKKMFWFASAAASFLLILGLAGGLYLYPVIYEYKNLHTLQNNEEFRGIQTYFNGEIDGMLVQLENSDQKSSLVAELSLIDQQIEKLKVELIYTPQKSREIIMQAIIHSFETKVQLLENAIHLNKEIKSYSHEKQQI